MDTKNGSMAGSGSDAQGGSRPGRRGLGGPFARKGAQPPIPATAEVQGGKAARPGRGQGEPRKGDARRRLSVICGLCVGVTVLSLGLGGAMMATSMRIKAELVDNTVRVVTATEDITAGTTIEAGKLTVADVPTAYAASDAVKVADGEDQATAIAKVAGHRALANLTKGNAVSLSTISGPDGATSLAQSVEGDHVAYMVTVDTATGVSPFLHVGDKVDVYVGKDSVEPRKLLDNITVLGLNGTLQGGGTDGYTTVTLDLTDAQALELFSNQDVDGTRVHLALNPATTLQDADASAQAARAQAQTAPAAQTQATQAAQSAAGNGSAAGAGAANAQPQA